MNWILQVLFCCYLLRVRIYHCASVRYPSLCDGRIFPLCQCIDRNTKIVCLLDRQPNVHPGDTFTVDTIILHTHIVYAELISCFVIIIAAQFTISGDNVPPTAQSLVIDGDRRFTVVVNEAANTQLKLKHLAFVAMAEVNFKADLSQVECLYLLMNGVLKFAGGIVPRVDITSTNDPFLYPGLGLDAQTTGTYLEMFSRQCELRRKFPNTITGK